MRRVLLTILLSALCAAAQAEVDSIIGVWRVVEIRSDQWTPESDPRMLRPTKAPLPSQIIFTPRHYSNVWMPGTEALRAFAERWNATDAEKIRRYGEVTVNTGTWVREGERIVLRPVVSRVPEFMGGTLVYGVRWEGERLVFTFLDETAFDGVPAPWVESSSGTMHLVLERIE